MRGSRRPAGRRQRKYVYGKTRAVVHERWLTLTAAARRGPVVSTSPRLREFLAGWLDEVVRPNLAPQTVVNYELFTRLYIVPDLGDRRLDKPTVRDVQVWLNALRDSSSSCLMHECGSGTLRGVVGLLRRVVREHLCRDMETGELRAGVPAFSLGQDELGISVSSGRSS